MMLWNRWKRLRRRTRVLWLLLSIVMSGALGVYFWLFADLPSISRLDAGRALPSTRIYDRNGRLLYEVFPPQSGRNTAIALADVPQHCINAVIATEDANYYSHVGVDVGGMARALWINVQGGEVLAGGSTITQQLARTLLFDPQQRLERTLRRKLRESILAIQLSNSLSKDDVLALYLNQMYFGNLAYGIEAAAQAYFGKSAPSLSLAECALLAGLMQNPSAYDPLTNLSAAQARQSVVFGLMVERGMILQSAADSAAADALQFAASPFPIEAPHFVMAVLKQLERDYGQYLFREGLDVTTTLNLDWQNVATRTMNTHLNYINHPPSGERQPANANNAALVALDPYSGQILVMVGSPNYFDQSIDGAVNAALALRQPGSALKPFTYAAAFDPTLAEPYTAATMLLDVQTPFVTQKLESYSPGNYGLVEHGPVSAREALASSLNIPSVVTLQDVGIGRMIQLSANAGLTTLADNPNLDLAVTLGGGEVRLLDLVQAYSIFPNGGMYVQPSYLLRVDVRGRDGGAPRTLYAWQAPAQSVRVLDARVSYLITDILSDNHARRLGFGPNSALNLGRPAAAKTGTTQDFRDNWIVGYTPNLVAGVWVGNADNTPMIDVTGSTGAAPLWNAFMRQVLLGQPELAFAEPDGLIRLQVCQPSGQLPTPACPHLREEVFISGTQPTETDTLYQTFMIDTRNGQLADATTPAQYQRARVLLVLPQEARQWGARHGLPLPPAVAQPINADDQVLRLLDPDPYTIYEIATLLPRETQRIRLSAGVPPNTRAVTFLLDGVAVGTSTAAPWEVWWVLQVGDHTLTAVATLADGTTHTSAPLSFRVVDYTPPASYNAGG
jgi:penicillin-binding protein 1C